MWHPIVFQHMAWILRKPGNGISISSSLDYVSRLWALLFWLLMNITCSIYAKWQVPSNWNISYGGKGVSKTQNINKCHMSERIGTQRILNSSSPALSVKWNNCRKRDSDNLYCREKWFWEVLEYLALKSNINTAI